MGKVYSQKEFIREAVPRGWTISYGRGKGSHVRCCKEGERPFPIPQKIKTGMNADIEKRLGIKDERRTRLSFPFYAENTKEMNFNGEKAAGVLLPCCIQRRRRFLERSLSRSGERVYDR
ncbi:hypothetical protein CE91St28_20790 [Pyramidobacter piscolens]|nr:hypothetical protein CE91St28_20790 [Pyramidobacter piscolens]